MPVDRPLRTKDVEVMLLWSNIIVPNPASDATCNRYDIAPNDEFQFNVGLVTVPTVPFNGLDKTGARIELLVVKLQIALNAVVPLLVVEFTRQKYVVPEVNPFTFKVFDVILL